MLGNLTNGHQIIATVDNQFGDTGKGRVAHALAEWADINSRGTGGDNAGHTVIVDGKLEVNHILPIGIFYDHLGKITQLGQGMVINPVGLNKELDRLDALGKPYNHLQISADAQVIMPYHIARDQAKNQSLKNGGIGSTGKGIGPCYGDKTLRRGIKIRDLLDTDTLAVKIQKAAQFYPEQRINIDDVIQYLAPHTKRIQDFIRDTTHEMHRYVKEGKKIAIEGAQGFGLSIDFGWHPYVTSSDPSIIGTAAGVGLNPGLVDLTLGLVKFPFMTRVGGGPFPSELGGHDGELYCQNVQNTVDVELEHYGVPFTMECGKVRYDKAHPTIIKMMNSEDPLTRAAGIRLVAEEFGATTRRPRRPGWTDGTQVKYANAINGPNMVGTKLDCLAGMDEFALCFGYQIGDRDIHDMPLDAKVVAKAEPILKWYEGFGDITGVRKRSDLPASLQEAMGDFEKYTDGRFVLASNGPKRTDNILC